jgi:RNA polymerase sigma-70 factor, ECF subfamily
MSSINFGSDGYTEDDMEKLSDLFDQNYKTIFNYILYSTGDIETALDLTSETFLKALGALPRYEYRGVRQSKSWLYKIASREIAMHYRRRAKEKKYLKIFSSLTYEIKEAVSSEDIQYSGNELERCEDFMILVPHFRRLPARYRMVLFLRFFEDKTLEEISQILGQPLGTVKSKCSRGLKLLRGWMQPLEEPEHLKEQRPKCVSDVDTLQEEVEESGT